MANNRKYAEDLIGNWETGQYEPQREVAQAIYQTNWNKLSNDFNTLKDKLARNFDVAQREYANTLNNIQNQSFNRMRNANIDLASRGLSTSGVGNLVNQADIQQKGEDVGNALNNLLNVNSSGIEGLTQGVTKLGQQQSSLAGNLAGDLGKITDQEAANAQQYAGLLAGIGESRASRAGRGGGSSKELSEEDELKRRLLIGDTLAATDLTDAEKQQYLFEYLDVPNDIAEAAVKAYSNNKKYKEQLSTVNDLASDLIASRKPTSGIRAGVNAALNRVGLVPYAQAKAQRKLTNAQEQLNDIKYTDIYDLLYNR